MEKKQKTVQELIDHSNKFLADADALMAQITAEADALDRESAEEKALFEDIDQTLMEAIRDDFAAEGRDIDAEMARLQQEKEVEDRLWRQRGAPGRRK